ncbi:hypothetical protein WJX72_002201 [[Myrmecia] bisecta]|uniref:Uncharacterized protein n=1 Tax=[Myrmecia] bisecta TaxID=41462 RepID=A0AAW1PW81_9CHLO
MHGQKNKPHKAGRHAGRSARQKHNLAKEAPRASIKAAHTAGGGRLQRLNAAKMQRDSKKQKLLAERRHVGPPRVVALLPLSEEVDVQRTVSLPGKSKMRLTLLPPPTDFSDPMAIVELGKAAEMIIMVVPGHEGALCVDASGDLALSVLRGLGMPTTVAVVQGAEGASLKARSAAKKRASAAIEAKVSGDHKMLALDNATDCQALLRHLAEHRASVPRWRQQRPTVMAEAADFQPAGDGVTGTLVLRGYVRTLGLSANQLVHVQGAGDFQILKIEGPPDPVPAANPGTRRGDADAMDVATEAVPVLARPDPQEQEALVRENVPDPLAGEQTWPTEEEMREAQQHETESSRSRKRRLPAGTSDYQAAWILDDDQVDPGESSDSDADLDADVAAGEGQGASTHAGEMLEDDDPDFPDDTESDALGLEGTSERDEDLALTKADVRRLQEGQQDDAEFPDEIDTPTDVAARLRFAKYRGLKSWRTSGWDPKESLPQDYARAFAFQNFRRAHKRAKALAATFGTVPDFTAVEVGTYVAVHIAGVPASAAQSVVERVAAFVKGEAVPLMVYGLLQHESKLSVVNFAIKKAVAYTEPIPNKEELLFMTGVRSYMAKPIFSSDEPQADKHKMERFLHPGRHCMATIFAPISYPPLPLLAFKRQEDGSLRLAATGSLRSCDPDRVTLKKLVLSGYPVKVQKKKAVVRWMFHNPEDVRWFRPLNLWTKYGRRGRIKEPMGTHGAMKCIFDGVIQQRDAVCVSLYKRVFPIWPQDLTFA